MDELINQAVASKDYVMLAVAVLLLAVPAGLKLAGKNVRGLDAGIELVKKILLTRAKIVPVVPPAEGEKTGIAAVVEIKNEEARKGPPES